MKQYKYSNFFIETHKYHFIVRRFGQHSTFQQLEKFFLKEVISFIRTEVVHVQFGKWINKLQAGSENFGDPQRSKSKGWSGQ